MVGLRRLHRPLARKTDHEGLTLITAAMETTYLLGDSKSLANSPCTTRCIVHSLDPSALTSLFQPRKFDQLNPRPRCHRGRPDQTHVSLHDQFVLDNDDLRLGTADDPLPAHPFNRLD